MYSAVDFRTVDLEDCYRMYLLIFMGTLDFDDVGHILLMIEEVEVSRRQDRMPRRDVTGSTALNDVSTALD